MDDQLRFRVFFSIKKTDELYLVFRKSWQETWVVHAGRRDVRSMSAINEQIAGTDLHRRNDDDR